MRYFNTSGPCDPEKHYTVRREALIAEGRKMVEQGRYFTIFAPRQAGKTTYFQLLLSELSQSEFTPIWISFENLKNVAKERFYYALQRQLARQLALYSISGNATLQDAIDLEEFFENLLRQNVRLVLVIDEFEGIPECVLNEIMHTFRKLYHNRQFHALHSLILVGVSTVAELVLSSASPFNIAEELHFPYFTSHDVRELIRQYVHETGQSFEEDVIAAIYKNTAGQPGLVCGMCQYLIDRPRPGPQSTITMTDFYPMLNHFTKERRDKNMLSIVQKAKEKRNFMLRLLFADEQIEFLVDNEEINYLSAHGVIDSLNGYADILVPLYRKRLINTFRPAINGEAAHYFSAHEGVGEYVTLTGLNLDAMLEKYRRYIRRRGFRAFDTDHLKEGAWHYSLDGFINFFIEQLGGQTFIETPSGRGRIDILILYNQYTYIIETKVFTTDYYFQKGKGQLAEYLTSEGLDAGYYVVFSNKHTQDDQLYLTEEIRGKRIHTYIICTQFDRPTDLPVPEELRRT